MELVVTGTVVDTDPSHPLLRCELVADASLDVWDYIGCDGADAGGVGEGADPAGFVAFVEGGEGGVVSVCGEGGVGGGGEGESGGGEEGEDDGEGEMHVAGGSGFVDERACKSLEICDYRFGCL